MKSSTINIGKITMGGNAPIVVQSMTNTNTLDVSATVEQCKRMIDAGAEMIRITVPSLKEIDSLSSIKQQLRSEGLEVPLIADVHFNPKVAEEAAKIVEKVRINPGNYTDKGMGNHHEWTDAEFDEAYRKMSLRAQPLLSICKEHGTAIRIGINHGSLSDRMVSRYGNTPQAMANSAMEWITICEENDFHSIVLSLKASNADTMIAATTALVNMMEQNGCCYPLHLGVTEAGAGDEGRIKSAVGIGTLLLMGIGNTIRVSLTEKPENEPPFAHLLLEAVSEMNDRFYFIDDNRTLHYHQPEKDREKWLASASAICGYHHYYKKFDNITIKNPHFSKEECTNLADNILQACRIKMSKAEIVSCPSCGRTQYDIESLLAKVKHRFSHYTGLKLAVMGCIVNGPGEMADADYGFVGASNGKVIVYQGKDKISGFLDIEDAFYFLEDILKDRYINL